MKFLLNGGVPRSIQNFLTSQGLDVIRLVQTDLFASPDEKVFSFAQSEGRILITRDKGFGDIRIYPPGTHQGIIVIRDLNLSSEQICEIFKEAWSVISEQEIKGYLVVINQRGVRIKKP